MKKITTIHIGDMREEWLLRAEGDYAKRLAPFCDYSTVHIKEERLPDSPNPAQIAAALKTEGERVAARLGERTYKIALCVEGEMMPSEAFGNLIAAKLTEYGGVAFVIGGSHGLCPEVKAAADLRLSLSPMTFPHKLMRVILAEQLYRAFSIASGGKYHK